MIENNQIANDLTAFKSDIEYISELQTQLEESHQKVFEEIINLTNMWEGIARQTFLERFAADSEKITGLLDLLRKDLSNLREARKKYGVCENQVEEIINSLKIESS